jgi:hypothetical protein
MNGNDYKVLVQSVKESNAFDHFGKAKPIVTVTYMVGDHGPFNEQFAKADFNAQSAKLKLQQMADQLRQLTT